MDGAIHYFKELSRSLTDMHLGRLEQFCRILEDAYVYGNMVFIFGNGGSASKASHLAQDLAKGALTDFRRQRRLKVLSLTDNLPCISAWANDEGYESIFEQQLRNFASPGDVAVAISGSGNSTNVVLAMQYAKDLGMRTVAMTGFDGGRLAKMVDCSIHIPSDNMGMVEVAHSAIGHFIVEHLRPRFAELAGVGSFAPMPEKAGVHSSARART